MRQLRKSTGSLNSVHGYYPDENSSEHKNMKRLLEEEVEAIGIEISRRGVNSYLISV